jgi:hypothetical protein
VSPDSEIVNPLRGFPCGRSRATPPLPPLSLLCARFARTQHHLDLFFSNEGDTDAVKAAREFEMVNVQNWIDERRARGSAGVTLEK